MASTSDTFVFVFVNSERIGISNEPIGVADLREFAQH